MALAIRNRFRRRQRPEDGSAPTRPDRPPVSVSFDAFAEDCRLSGRLDLTTDRLAEFLNGSAPIVLTDVVIEAFADGRRIELAQLTVDREELCAVVVTSHRGAPSRRLHTRSVAVEIVVGPYRIAGAAQGPPGSDPASAGLGRRQFVALTEATIAYGLDPGLVGQDVPVLLVNRSLARSIRPVEIAPGTYTRTPARQEGEPTLDSSTNREEVQPT